MNSQWYVLDLLAWSSLSRRLAILAISDGGFFAQRRPMAKYAIAELEFCICQTSKVEFSAAGIATICAMNGDQNMDITNRGRWGIF